MKRISKATVLAALALLAAPASFGQTLPDSDISVVDLSVSRHGDKLFVSMDLDVSSARLGRDREVYVTPFLRGGDNSQALPSVILAGRSRYYHHLRNDESVERLYRGGKQDKIEYRAVLPYERWMGSAVLEASTGSCACLGKSLSESVVPLRELRLERREPAPFKPLYAYVRPRAERKVSVIEGSAYVDFRVNKVDIDPEYRRNPEELGKILSTIESVSSDSDCRIMSVSVTGYASPEGTYANNARLASGRTEALRDYVLSRLSIPDSLFTTSFVPEDWEGLERYVASSSLEDKEGILEIIRGGLAPDPKEWKIKSTYPLDYASLLRDVYPGLRHSDYSVRYEVRPYTDVEEIRRLVRTRPQNLSLNEMYLAAETLEPGSEEYDDMFETAVRMFPDDPVANVNAASSALRRGDLERASVYLSKAGDSPEAVYSRGLLAAFRKDYSTAERLLDEAGRFGVTQAGDALSQLAEIRAVLAENEALGYPE